MSAAALVLQDGDRVFIGGGSGTPVSVWKEILGRSGLRITATLIPGVNSVAVEDFGAGTVVSGFFMFPSLGDAQRQGAYRHVPMSYAAIGPWLKRQTFDACVVQVSTPRPDGRVSLGPAAEFTPGMLQHATQVIAVVNPQVPFVDDAPSLRLRDCAQVIERDEPLVGYGAGEVDAVSSAVAARVAGFVTDGAALQLGLGKVPAALAHLLGDRRGLKLHSGMLSDGAMELAERGALDPDFAHVTTMFLGSPKLYAWIGGRTGIQLRGCEQTHDPLRLGSLERLIAVNSALSVDLFGQCNLETAGGRAMSGCGGAPDFARAARLSPGGVSIVALPASAGKNRDSRIVSNLGAGGIATLARTEADVVVTEEGVADLRGLSVMERAESLIAIAPPAARSRLSDEWREIAARL